MCDYLACCQLTHDGVPWLTNTLMYVALVVCVCFSLLVSLLLKPKSFLIVRRVFWRLSSGHRILRPSKFDGILRRHVSNK